MIINHWVTAAVVMFAVVGVDLRDARSEVRHVYYRSGGDLYRADADGGNQLRIGSAPGDLVRGDFLNGRLYFTRGTTIVQTNLDLSNQKDLVSAFSRFPIPVALDTENQEIYYATHGLDPGFTATVFRKGVEGNEDPVVIFTQDFGFVITLEFHPDNNRLYMPFLSIDSDGGNPTSFSTPCFENPKRIVATPSTLHIACNIDLGSGDFGRVGLDGNPPDVETEPFSLSADHPFGVDPDAKDYYVSIGNDGLYRVSYDGVTRTRIVSGRTEGVVVDTSSSAIDTTPPEVALLAPVPGTTNNELVSLTGLVSDDTLLSLVTWEQNGEDKGPVERIGESFSVDGVRLALGSNVFKIYAEDLAGNRGMAEVEVIWDPDRQLTLEGTPETNEGNVVSIPIQLNAKGRFSGMTFAVDYDATYFEEPEIQFVFEPILLQGNHESNSPSPGLVIGTYALAGQSTPEGNNTLAILSFRARSVPENTTSTIGLRIEDVSDFNGQPLKIGNYSAGTSVSILRREYLGDINANGRLDTGDASLMQQLIARIQEPRTWDLALNDLNESGGLDSGDVVIVLRTVVGLDSQPSVGELREARDEDTQPASKLSFTKPPAPSEEFELNVELTDLGEDIAGTSFYLEYPSEVARLMDSSAMETGALVTGGSFALWNVFPDQNDFANQSGTVSMAATSATPWPNSAAGGSVAKLRFMIADTYQPGDQLTFKLSRVEVPASRGYDVLELSPATLQVDGQPVELSFSDWLDQHFSAEEKSDALIAGWNADPDADGHANGVEFFYGSLPRVASAPPEQDVSIRQRDGSDVLEIEFFQRQLVTGAVLGVEQSPNLVDWLAVPVEAISVSEVLEGGGKRTRLAIDSLPGDAAPQQFLRTTVTQQ